jgi:enoyl-CoA hydratase/carnithine racemase
MTVARAPARAPVAVDVRPPVATITLQGADGANALDLRTQQALVDACGAVEEDARVRAVVLGARGRSFCAGLPEEMGWPPATWPDAIEAVWAMGKPVVVALSGDVTGWGLGLALACDLRVAGADVVFRVPAPSGGRFPGGGTTQRLPRLIGPARAAHLLMLGGRVGAREAATWGLVDRVVLRARVRASAGALARTLARQAPIALRYAKEAVRRALDMPLDDGIRLEHDLYVLLQTTADREEGVRAFLERRRPAFQNR